MLSPELLKKVEALSIHSRRRVTDVFVGEYESAFRGRGIEFEEFREYVPGDDVRTIDWNVTARFDRPFVKVFREEREQTIFFLVDVSASLDFGRARTKREAVSELSALLAYAAIKSNDKVGLVLFSDQIERYIAPKKGRAHVWGIIAALLSHQPKSRGTNVASALEFFLKVAHRSTTCFLISDFLGTGFERALSVAAVRHDFVAIRVLDAAEKALPAGAMVEFVGLEDGEPAAIDLGSRRLRDNFLSANQVRDSKLTKGLRSQKIDFLDLSLDQDVVDALLQYFLRREKGR